MVAHTTVLRTAVLHCYNIYNFIRQQ